MKSYRKNMTTNRLKAVSTIFGLKMNILKPIQLRINHPFPL